MPALSDFVSLRLLIQAAGWQKADLAQRTPWAPSNAADVVRSCQTRNLAALAADLGSTSVPEYRAAAALAAQSPLVPSFLAGQRSNTPTTKHAITVTQQTGA